MTKIVSNLPVSEQTTALLVAILLRLDKWLFHGGVDDSDGVVGDFMQETVSILEIYVQLDSRCVIAFKKLADKETGFEWEKPLLKHLLVQNLT